jgi:hypothetical protein
VAVLAADPVTALEKMVHRLSEQFAAKRQMGLHSAESASRYDCCHQGEEPTHLRTVKWQWSKRYTLDVMVWCELQPSRQRQEVQNVQSIN